MFGSPFPYNRSASAGLLSGLVVVCFGGVAHAQSCSLATPVLWVSGASGVWADGVNWSSGSVPDSPTTNVCITDGLSTVALNTNISVGSLQLAAGNTLSMLPGTNLAINGPQFIGSGNLAVNASRGSNSISASVKT